MQGVGGDPRRPSEAVPYAKMFSKPNEPPPDAQILIGSVFGMAALLMKVRLLLKISVAPKAAC